ncbi:oligosaccharide flippase family protein [Sagittula sp. SSi028]|uniref:oligosaccharide flippase family protein n=1 Tax=Sagittula sp. SSi028 TaxID=3400636 RepID=UPI003AF566BC
MSRKPGEPTSAQKPGGAGNAAISFIALSSQQLSAFVITLLAAGVLGAGEYGVYTLAVVFVEFVVMLAYTGYFHFLVTSDEDETAVLSTTFWIMLGIGVLGGLVMVLTAGLVALAFDAPQLAPVLRAFGLLQPFASMIGWATAALTRAGRMRPYFLSLGVSNFGAMIGGTAALLIWPSVYALVIFRVIRIGLGIIFFGLSLNQRPSFLFDRRMARDATRYAAGLYGARLLTFFSNFGTDLVLAAIFSTAEAGLYRFANRIASATVDLVAQPLRSFSLKSFGQAARTERPLADVFALYFGMSILLVGGAAVTLMILGPEAIRTLFHPEYAAAIIATQAMALRAFARVGQSMIEPVFSTRKTTNLAMWFNLALAAAMLGSILAFANQGVTVLAIAQAGVQLISLPLAIWAIARGAEVDIWPGLRRAGLAMVLLTGFAAALWISWWGLGQSGLAPGWRVGAGALTALSLGGMAVAIAMKLQVLSLRAFAD